MSIPITRYVSTVSALGVGTAVSRRELIGRFFTTSAEIPANGIAEFTSANEALTRFGSSSEEYKRAAFYFGFISKSLTKPNKLSFARWVDTDIAAYIFGGTFTSTLADLQAVTAGAITLTLGADTETISSIDLSSETSLTEVAAALQVAIRAANVDASFASCVVAWDATNGRFTFTSGETGDEAIVLSSSTGLDTLLAWTAATGAIISEGLSTQTVTEVLAASTASNNNFGSFAFTYTAALSDSEIIEAATWNDGNNVLYQYHVAVTASNYSTVMAAIGTLGGNGVTLRLSTLTEEYPEVLPMAVLAATNYGAANSVKNYMFQQASLTPTVTTESAANTYDAVKVNYYGQTQTGGTTLSFYQRGVLTGQGNDIVNMNTFANEQWLKDAVDTNIFNLLLGLEKLSANAEGRNKLIRVIRGTVDDALANGTIAPGKTLTEIQKIAIAD
ncbi:MAG: DUF3383 domain-containing protein, partial [Candidatus Pacearchaeota archaeon]|nr:DUF3383 domain-containing protein [Candidatus Pacearchaeota archaeon]